MEITRTARDAADVERLPARIWRKGLDAHLAGDGGPPEPAESVAHLLRRMVALTRGGPDGLEMQLALRAEWDHRDTLPPESP